jgi:hypothetical protein
MDRMLDDGDWKPRNEIFDQGIMTAAEDGLNLLTKGAQPLKSFCIHAVSMPKCDFLVYTFSPPPC